MKKFTTKSLAVTALVAALYSVLTLAVPALSYGAIQFRIGEALTVLPAIIPGSTYGLVLGCFLSNLIGALSGINPLGFADSFFGTVATLIAAVLTKKIGEIIKNKPLKLCLIPFPAVLTNGLIISAELCLFGILPRSAYLTSCLWISLGEFGPCYLLGLPLYIMLSRADKSKNILQ